MFYNLFLAEVEWHPLCVIVWGSILILSREFSPVYVVQGEQHRTFRFAILLLQNIFYFDLDLFSLDLWRYINTCCSIL